MGITCCKRKYDNEFFIPESTYELVQIYKQELNTINKEIRYLDKNPKNLNDPQLKFMQIFYLRVDDLTQKLQGKHYKNFYKLKELSNDLFCTLDDCDEQELKRILLDIYVFMRKYESTADEDLKIV